MANNNHGHHEHHEHHHGHDHGHGHDTDEMGLPTPMTFVLAPNSQAIITVAFYGPFQKQILLKEQSGADTRVYNSCVDGRRPYIVISNTSLTQTLYYSITPSMYTNTCLQPTGTTVDLTLKGTMSGTGSSIQSSFMYALYGMTGTLAASDQVGVTIVIQDNVGDLVS